jgi:NADPH-dependent 2,4-dienoyl-CoA reductase/sulfur reductase-like enzyme
MNMTYDLIVIGAGPAGLAAAQAAWEAGLKHILIIERDKEAGGILNQCIHNGFGLHLFKQELTGPEFAGRFIDALKQTGVELMLDTMVLSVEADHRVHVVNSASGYQCLTGQTIILAMGCRERTRGAIAIPGTRPAGIYTAGAAQRYMNIDGYLVGSRVVILGSGDIGLIMARRMTLEGAKVLACVELMPYSGGLPRNIAQCLKDFDIPLYLSHTITDIKGDPRVTSCTVAQVDEHRRPIPGTEREFECDTILLSVGLIPENELSRQAGIVLDPRTKGPLVYENMETSIPGIFACGNVVHVHDLADNVAMEAAKAGRAAAQAVLNGPRSGEEVSVSTLPGVTYTVPQHLHLPVRDPLVEFSFRVNRNYGKSRILLKDESGQTLARYQRDFMVPGSMEKITVPQVLLEKRSGGLILSVEEGEAA